MAPIIKHKVKVIMNRKNLVQLFSLPGVHFTQCIFCLGCLAGVLVNGMPSFFPFSMSFSRLGPHLAQPHTGPSTSKACDLGLYLTINILKSQDVGHGGFLCLVLNSQRDLTPTPSYVGVRSFALLKSRCNIPPLFQEGYSQAQEGFDRRMASLRVQLGPSTVANTLVLSSSQNFFTPKSYVRGYKSLLLNLVRANRMLENPIFRPPKKGNSF
jgi:hypothetical protein